MFKPLLTLAAAGVVGVALWKVLSFLFLPLLGTALGMLLTAVKIALLVGLVCFVLAWLRKDKDKSKDGEAPTT